MRLKLTNKTTKINRRVRHSEVFNQTHLVVDVDWEEKSRDCLNIASETSF